MTIRRHLLNMGARSVDVRIGVDALEDLSRMVKGTVGIPRRAAFLSRADEDARVLETVRHALIDAGFKPTQITPPAAVDVTSAQATLWLWDEMDRCGLTRDDLIVCVGDAALCSLTALCAKLWCGGMSSTLIPTTLDAMVTSATTMRPLGVTSSDAMLSFTPDPTLVVCDLTLVQGRPAEELEPGYVALMATMLADNKRNWEKFGTLIPKLLNGEEIALVDALGSSQLGRRGVLMAASPSARNALSYGVETAYALRSCLGADIPWHLLWVEGMRFEARLAVDACKFDPEVVFEQDDRFEELGVDELQFDLDAQTFIDAIKTCHAKRSNRFMFALPKMPGTIRLTAVSDEILERHAAAYVASRAEA